MIAQRRSPRLDLGAGSTRRTGPSAIGSRATLMLRSAPSTSVDVQLGGSHHMIINRRTRWRTIGTDGASPRLNRQHRVLANDSRRLPPRGRRREPVRRRAQPSRACARRGGEPLRCCLRYAQAPATRSFSGYEPRDSSVLSLIHARTAARRAAWSGTPFAFASLSRCLQTLAGKRTDRGMVGPVSVPRGLPRPT